MSDHGENMEDDDFLEIDSPEEHPVDLEDDEEDQEAAALERERRARGDGATIAERSDPSSVASSSRINAGAAGKAGQPSGSQDKRDPRLDLLDWPESLPYECESLQEFDERAEWICRRLVDCVRTRDFDIGLVQWNHKLQCLLSLKYPLKRTLRARLARLYYHLAATPTLEPRLIELAASMCMTLVESRKRIDIKDLVLPWRLLYDALEKDLFPKQRRTGLSNISSTLLDLAESCQRFFHPSATREMLDVFLPKMDGNSLDSVIATQALLVHFLPTSHGQPRVWLKMMFRLSKSFNSSLWDDQMLDLLARLSTQNALHPEHADERHIASSVGKNADAVEWAKRYASGASEPSSSGHKTTDGLWREVGILTDEQFQLIMTKCLRSAGLPVGANKVANKELMAQSSANRAGVDAAASGLTVNMKKPSNRLQSFATIIAFSLRQDGPSHALEEETSLTPPGRAEDTAKSSTLGSAWTSLAATPELPSTPTTVAAAASSSQLSPQKQTYLAGSKALDHLARLIQATESFFHPSNWGPWQIQLTSLIKFLTGEVLRRIREEEKPDCKIAKDKRITPEIRRTFVKITRNVCLMSMFGKDPITISNSQLSLRYLALLEPDLVIPEIFARAVPSLEALETTHRTTSVISCLGTLSFPMISRKHYREGAKHLVPLMTLCLPGIDLNDPLKTIATTAFYIMAAIYIRIDDLNRPELASESDTSVDADPEALRREGMSKEEDEAFDRAQDQLTRLSTASFEDWAVTFFRRVLQLFDALPDEGKNGKIGGKSEQQVVTSVLGVADMICANMSAGLFDTCFDVVVQHCANNVSANGISVVGALVGSFARADSDKVLKRLLSRSIANVRAELENGASSVMTTRTTEANSGDTAIHWHLHIIIHTLSGAGPRLLAYKKELFDFLHELIDKCKNERTYSVTSRLVQKVLIVLTFYYPNEAHCGTPAEWASPEYERESHLHWGKTYLVKEADVSWHCPSDDEIAMALELLESLTTPLLQSLGSMLDSTGTRDKVWSADFCRRLSYVKQMATAVPHLLLLQEEGGGAEASDGGVEVPEFIAPPPRFKSSFLLTDPQDPRYQRALALRNSIAAVLLKAAQTTQASEAEDQIDCVKLLLRTMRTFMTQYSYSTDDESANAAQLTFYRNMTRLFPQQKLFPRIYWIRRAAFYNTSRSRLNSFHRKRSPIDDQFIAFVVELCLSNYVGIRKTAQIALETITAHYDGTKELCIPTLLNAIQPGTGDDRMKGALYVLGSKGFSNFAIVDPRFTVQYVTALLAAQHHPKPSIQKLVRGILGDFVVRFAEPSRLRHEVALPSELEEAADLLEASLSDDKRVVDEALLQRVREAQRERVRLADQMTVDLERTVLETATSPNTHWSFALYAARLLRIILRRDQPISAPISSYFAREVVSDNPQIRRSAAIGLVKVLLLIKLRTMCKTPMDLHLMRSKNPLKRVQAVGDNVSDAFTAEYFQEFGQPLQADSKLRDKASQGWLVWASELDYYAASTEGSGVPFDWDATSGEAIQAVRAIIADSQWWAQVFTHLSQEKDRNYIGAETINLIKSIFQIFGPELVPLVREQVEQFVQERDRHKHRAAAEVISGVVRGSKHWALPAHDSLWSWLSGLIPRIFKEATPDSQPAWQMCVEYMLQHRDPRRARPLIDYLTQTAKDSIGRDGGSPWEQSKAQAMLRGAILALDGKFLPWAQEFIDLYDQHFAHDFVEIRLLVSESLADLELLCVHPSYASVDALLKDSEQQSGSMLARPEAYRSRLQRLAEQLAKWRTERIPTSQGTSAYDRAAVTALFWILTTLGDHRHSALASEVIPFLPHIFAMLELHDNKELSMHARRVLTRIAAYPFPVEHVGPLIREVLKLIRGASESWRLRLDALPLLQVVYYQNLFYLDPVLVQDIIELLFGLLSDSHLEVREMAATTLSGIVRCSQRKLIKRLRDRFTAIVADTVLPRKSEPDFSAKLVKLHSGLLGATALIGAFPYEVPPWMPEFICNTVVLHADDPVPISTTIRACAADFKRTHQDTWAEDSKKFSEEQLQEVNDWTLGRSDYFA